MAKKLYSLKATDLARAMGITVVNCDGNGHFIEEKGPIDDFELTPVLTPREEELLRKRDEILNMDHSDFIREVTNLTDETLQGILNFG